MSSSNAPSFKQAGLAIETPGTASVHIRPSLRRGGNLLLDLPIAGRLTLGFLIAALIATSISSMVGVLRAQSLSRQSSFYQSLLQTNTSLNTGANFLELMNSETHVVLDLAVQQTSQETLTADKNALPDLSNRYNQILNNYISNSLVEKHPDEVALLNEAGHSEQITQQQTLASSVLRTWRLYQTAQVQILQDLATKHLDDAQTLLRVQAEPTNADAQSAVRSLIQFDQRLATSIQEAAAIEEQQQLITTIAGSILAFLLIVFVGWLISNTLVKRLRQLRQITRQVEKGQIDARVMVVGRDEIADVSASVNAMLDAIVGLVEETRSQRDALTNAAEHLFSDMRVVSAGELRVNAPVSSDPIGMLANAFNFTVGRFRRFVLRTQTTVEQMEVVSRQQLERADTFSNVLANYMASPAFQSIAGGQQTTGTSLTGSLTGKGRFDSGEPGTSLEGQTKELLQRLQVTHERVQKLNSSEGFSRHTRAILNIAEQISGVVNKLSKVAASELPGQTRLVNNSLTQLHLQELHTLEGLLQRLTVDLQSVQNSNLKNMQELEISLVQMGNAIQASKPTAEVMPGARSKEMHLEVVRQGQSFASEVTAMARKLASLAQEMRAGVVSFHLETNDAGIKLDGVGGAQAFHSEPFSGKDILHSSPELHYPSASQPVLHSSGTSLKSATR